MKNESGKKTMTYFAELRPKTYSNLMYGRKGYIKDKILENGQIISILQKRFKSQAHIIFNEKFNYIALSFNDYKRLQSFNKLISCLYGTIVGKIC